MPTRAVTPPALIDLHDPSLYLNRELALLHFQERVLEEADDHTNPLLERCFYLSILSSNLSEFYMVRVAGLRQQIEAGVSKLSDDGMTPAEQLAAVRVQCRRLMEAARESYGRIHGELDDAGIHIRDYTDLTEAQRRVADSFFTTSVYPVLTPLAFDPGRPFPHISNLSMNLAVVVKGPDGAERFARVKVPRGLPRLIRVDKPVSAEGSAEPGREYTFVWLEQLITAHAASLFPGFSVVGVYAFRVTRDADTSIQELEADDLLQSIEQGVRRRRFGSVVRMTVGREMPEHIRDILVKNLKMDPEDVITLAAPLGMSQISALGKLDRPDLKFRPFVPVDPIESGEEGGRDLFEAIRQRDILLHQPYESFQPIVDFLHQAACDPDVLAIKMTLYRVGRDSPIVQALMEAAEEGKEVACLVELKARFDEESNIEWARALEQAGVHVVYGFVGLKTHSKVALVVRRERGKIVRYVHIGTGNYNAVTARQYEDLGMFTCDPKIGADASELFNVITGYAAETRFKRLVVAPAEMRLSLEQLIRREIANVKDGKAGRITFKMNALQDKRLIEALYEASAAGVRIDLIIRGICCLRPGVADLSENITVRSIVGRFLEHSRIYWFDNAGEPTVLIGSADLMPRNLDRRIEVLAPVTAPAIVKRLRSVLDTYLADNVKARRMLPDGTYERVEPSDGKRVEAQAVFLEEAANLPAPSRRKRKKLGTLTTRPREKR
jgi:polyphosphate kinase